MSDSKYREAGHAYVEKTIPAIVKTWDTAPLLAHADLAFRKQTSDAQARELMAAYRRDFGGVNGISLIAGSVGMNVGAWVGKFAQFTYSLDCEKGSAIVVVSVHQTTTGEWRILGFHVESSQPGSSAAHPG